MATRIQEAMTSSGMRLTIFCGGQSYVGIRLAGTFVATVQFRASTDGINFSLVSVTPFASGTDVQSATSTGNWFFPVGNYVAFQLNVSSYTSGTIQGFLAASTDASYQDAYLTPTSIYNVSESTSTNTMTQAAQANRAWTLKSLVVSVAGSSWAGGSARVTVFDGTITDSVLHAEFLQEIAVAGSVGRQYVLTLPSQGVKGTPGNAMTIRLLGPGAGVTSILNAEFSAG